MKNIYVILILYTFLSACGDVGKVLRNEKIKTTDEFLVKKKITFSFLILVFFF